MELLIAPVIFALPAFVLASFTGGFASAIAAGGREDHSLWVNACIGFVSWLIASTVWSANTGSWPQELYPGLLLLTLVLAVGVAWLWDRRVRAGDGQGGITLDS